MWPWEHAIVGYLAYSAFCHLYYRDSPGGLEALAVVVASVLPDLIDKPLTWTFDVFEVGYAIGHSIFFAVALSVAVGALVRSVDRPRTGIAFAVGYLLHLPADIVDRYVRDDHLSTWIVLWPLRRDEARPYAIETDPGFVDQFFVLFGTYRHELFAADPSAYVLLQFGMAGSAALLWLYDGAPVFRECLVGVKRLVEATIDRVESRTR